MPAARLIERGPDDGTGVDGGTGQRLDGRTAVGAAEELINSQKWLLVKINK